ncbi:MAG: Rpn family recombination-promoting nuclease/putative transposase [Spirochaetaceae bacterium]|jgi:predicted transposase/invertase (TIGR01784 family)|nr:Rpn family recombination-promoting nuclease/putative transposase [Spirochaetaceae bacterium]
MGVNTGYKDSVFSLLFSEPETLRELYSALEGVPLDKEIPITINTLSDVLYMERYNDISFTIGNKLVILIEHQSSVNPNMPLRILLYIARIYEKIIERKSLYRETLLKIPRPEFFVLYNGPKPYPDQSTLRLSDAFENTEDIKAAGLPPELELTVKVYNINKGHNEGLVKKCAALSGYSTFIDKIREHRQTMPLEAAMKTAIEYCIEHNVLSKFLVERSSEVINMLLTEWNWDDAKEVWQEEASAAALAKGIAEGRAKGIAEGRAKGIVEERREVLDMLEKGYTVEQLKAWLASGESAANTDK